MDATCLATLNGTREREEQVGWRLRRVLRKRLRNGSSKQCLHSFLRSLCRFRVLGRVHVLPLLEYSRVAPTAAPRFQIVGY